MISLFNKGRNHLFYRVLDSTHKKTKKSLLILASIFTILFQGNADVHAAPVVTPIAPPTIDEGSATPNPIASYSNIDTTLSHTATIDWGDGAGVQAYSVIEFIGTGDVDGFTVYGDEGTGSYSSTICVIDSTLASNCQPLTITVNNVAPVISGTPLTNPTAADEGSLLTLSTFDFTDPSTVDDYTVTIDWGDPLDGADTIVAIASGTSPFTVPDQTHSYGDDENGPFTITITVEDSDGGIDSTTVSATVNNADPVVTAGVNQSVGEGVLLNLNDVIFTDGGTGDTHSAFIDWGDGNTTSIPLGTDTSPLSGYSNTYADNGIYNVQITVTDDDAVSGVGIDTVVVTVTNDPPAITTGGVESWNEGALFTLASIDFADDGLLDTHSAQINWGDTGITDIPSVTAGVSITGQTHTYTDNGSYPITITITDNDLGTGVDTSRTVNISNIVPLVSDPTSYPVFTEGTTTSSVIVAMFTNAGISDNPHSATIDWGDFSGDAGTVVEVPGSGEGNVLGTHVYTTQGSNTISVQVTDKDGGNSLIHQYEILVGNTAPVITVPGVQFVDEGSLLTVDTISYVDFGGDAGSGDLHLSTIDWDGGVTVVGPTTVGVNQTANTISGTNTYADDGSYSVDVTVTDDQGLTDTGSFSVTVNNIAPSITTPGNQNVDILVALPISTTFTDPGTSDTHTATINWGDGTIVGPTTVGVNSGAGTVDFGSHSYATNGDFTVTMTITDEADGASFVTDSITVTVNNANPIVTTLVTSSTANEGSAITLLPTTFTDLGTTDSHTAKINWGDGSPEEDGTVDQLNNTVSGSHVYTQHGTYGTYGVTVTVLDNGTPALSGSDITTVTINNVAPTVTALIDSASIFEGDMVSLSPSTFADVGIFDTHTAKIDWGDGSIEGPTTIGIDQDADTLSGSHVYVDQGTYTISITVLDDDGGISASDITTIRVNNVAPVVGANDFTFDEDSGANNFALSVTDVGLSDTLVYLIISSTTGGSLTGVAPNTLTYTPNANYNGVDTIIFSVFDGVDTVSPATATINVTPVNDAPDPLVDPTLISTYLNVDGTTTIDPRDEDLNDIPQVEVITYTVTTPPGNGSVSIDSVTGVVTYSPNLNYTGPDTFDVLVEDSSLGAITVTIPVSIFGADGNKPSDGTVTPTAGNSSNDLSWSETHVYDQLDSLNYSDDLSGVDYYSIVFNTGTGSPPVDCSGTSTTIYSVVDSITTTNTYTYTHGSLSNGTQYNYRICATDTAGNISDGVTASATPSAPPGISLPGYDANGNGVERIDGGDDSNNLDTTTSNPVVDMEYYFSIVVSDVSTPNSVKIYISTRADGSNPTAYPMTCGSNYSSGALCTFTTILGPGQDHRYYFEVIKADTTTLREPAAGFNTGPEVGLLNAYAMVGIPRNYNSTLPEDFASPYGSSTFTTAFSFRWVSTNLSQGSVNFGSYEGLNISATKTRPGEGYYILTTSLGTTLPSYDALPDNVDTTYTSTYSLNPGWNIISNPYGGIVYLSDVLVNGLPWLTAAGNGTIVNGLYYYNGQDWASTYTLIAAGGAPDAKLIPWLGYWVYVKDSIGATITIPKP